MNQSQPIPYEEIGALAERASAAGQHPLASLLFNVAWAMAMGPEVELLFSRVVQEDVDDLRELAEVLDEETR